MSEGKLYSDSNPPAKVRVILRRTPHRITLPDTP